MPSPVGHVIAGATIAWLSMPPGGNTEAPLESNDLTSMTWAAAFLAAAPDLDLLFPWTHRTASHSIAAVVVVCLVISFLIGVTGKVTAWSARRIVLTCTLAYASHLVLDWMAVDDTPPRGIQVLWPFSQTWYISGWDLFRGTARLDVFTPAAMRQNLLAVVQETLTLGPIAWLVWSIRVKPATGLSTKVSRRHHAAE
jgi:inner membrane protein